MKILYFSRSYTPHDHRFLSAISGADHEVFYLRLEDNLHQVEDRPVPSRVQQVQWAGGRGPFRWRDVPRLGLDLKRRIRKIGPDLVHAGPIQTCAFLSVLTGFRPILSMSWGYDLMQDADRGRWWEWVTRFALRCSAFFVSDANVTREKAVALGMDPARTVVFPWGVDLDHFTPKKWSNPTDNVTLFCNRSWEPLYGVDVLAKAFVQVAAQRPEIGLILLGGGSQGTALRQILQQGGVLEQIHFGGLVSQKDLPDWYHQADLYISPSHVDGSSVSLMEALACGLPVLVSDIPGNREWVREGENGWLFPDGDVDQLAAKILQALEQRQSFPKIGAKARAVAETRADWKKNAATLLQTYETILAMKGQSPEV